MQNQFLYALLLTRFASLTRIPIQSYYFARDDRVYKAFVDRLDQHRSAIQQSCSKRLRWQLGILKNRFEGRNISYRVCQLP